MASKGGRGAWLGGEGGFEKGREEGAWLRKGGGGLASKRGRGSLASKRERGWIFSYTPESHIAFCPIFVHPTPHSKMGLFCPSSPFDLPKCQTIIRVSVCVKASRAEGLTFPNVKNDVGQTIQSVFLRRRRRPSQEHGLCPRLGFQPSFLLNIAGRRPAMFSRKAG